jgi:putative heme iron utilization protein
MRRNVFDTQFLRNDRHGRRIARRGVASVLFVNVDGGIMFKVFVGRDDKRELLADQLAAFRALADRTCA